MQVGCNDGKAALDHCNALQGMSLYKLTMKCEKIAVARIRIRIVREFVGGNEGEAIGRHEDVRRARPCE